MAQNMRPGGMILMGFFGSRELAEAACAKLQDVRRCSTNLGVGKNGRRICRDRPGERSSRLAECPDCICAIFIGGSWFGPRWSDGSWP
jgi:hypothetical protein